MTIKITTLLFAIFIFVNYAPRTCRTHQPLSGALLITATKNLLAMTEATVRSANIDGKIAQEKIEEISEELERNATAIIEGIDQSVKETLDDFTKRIEDLVANGDDAVVANDCLAMENSTFVKSAGAKIIAKANSCVSNTADSIEKQFNETYVSIESVLAKINSEHKTAETCLAEYDRTEMALRNAVITALCVNQAKERILAAIKDEILPWNDAAKIHILSNDVLDQMMSCDDKEATSSFIADAELIYVKIKTCIRGSKVV